MGQDSEQTGDRTCAEEYRVQGTEDRTGSRGVYTVEQGSKGQGIRNKEVQDREQGEEDIIGNGGEEYTVG